MTFTYHQDPSHGWIEVPLSLIDKLGIASNISPYSYRCSTRKIAYLEEDRDANVFLMAYDKASGAKAVLKEEHLDRPHWIRDLAMFEPPAKS